MKNIAIYSRVSTDKQSVERQLMQLRDFAKRSDCVIVNEYVDDGYSGKNTKRPAYQEMMNDAKKRKFDALFVWDLSRLSRSLKDLIITIETLEAYKVDFVCYNQNIDTFTPSGKLLFHIVGAISEFQRAIIRENVISGLENAKRKGKRLGRPGLVVSEETINKIKDLRSKGMSMRDVGKIVGISHSMIGGLEARR